MPIIAVMRLVRTELQLAVSLVSAGMGVAPITILLFGVG